MATPPIGSPLSEELIRKLHFLRHQFDCGRWRPDPFMVAWAVGVLKACGELELARDYERIARRLLPNFQKDLG